jgi:hypothetical protein
MPPPEEPRRVARVLADRVFDRTNVETARAQRGLDSGDLEAAYRDLDAVTVGGLRQATSSTRQLSAS